MPYTNNQDVKIYYEVEGIGPPLVLAYGLSSSIEDWRDLGYVELLKHDFQLILVDARGHGKSSKPHDPTAYTVKVRVEDYVAVLNDLALEKAHFLGYSTGGSVGFCLGQFAPDRFLSVIIGGNQPYPPTKRLDHIPIPLEKPLHGLPQTRDPILELLYQGAEAWVEFWEQNTVLPPKMKARLLANDFKALRANWQHPDRWRVDIEPILPNFPLPTLIYVGEAESYYPGAKECTQEMPNATFVPLSGCHHLDIWTNSERIVPHIKTFLQNLSKGQFTSRVRQDLTHLETVGLLRLAKTHPELEFLFRHALVQEVAYNSLLYEDRKRLHRKVGESLELIYPNRLDELSPTLAEHFIKAEEVKKALHYLQKAGEHAVNSYANQEAISYFNQTLSLLMTLPSSPKRDSLELALQIALGRLLFAMKGYGNPEGKQVFDRALQLSEHVGEPRQRFAALHGLWGSSVSRAELQTARKIIEQLLILAQSMQISTVQLWAHYGAGITFFWLGELVTAQEHREQLLVLYDPQRHGPQFRRVTEDPGVNSLGYSALTLWLLGYPNQAAAKIQEALHLAQDESHPFTLAFAYVLAAHLSQFRREEQTAQQYAEAAMAISTEHKFPSLLGWGTIFLGWSLAKQGQAMPEGINHIRQGLAITRATGTNLAQTYMLALLVEAYQKAGQIEEAFTILEEALEAVESTSERVYETELYRLKGDLLLIRDDHSREIEANYQQAIEIARRRNVKSLELRATMSLCHLWRSQGKQEEARRMLVEIYNWFTEGFDTPDLKRAKTLLEELS